MEKFKRYFLELDDDLNIRDCSKSFIEYIGQSDVNALDKIIPVQDLSGLKSAIFAISPGQSALSCFRVRKKDGSLSWIAATIEKPENSGDSIKMDLSDIQSMKTDRADGFYDKMTGVYSKSAITEYAQSLMHKDPPEPFYFFLMDVDNFKSVNDTYGHMKGDDVIIEVAKTAQHFVGDKGYVGRIGGDEFMLVLEKVSTEPELREILRNIRYTIREKYMDEKNNTTITVSMGGALYPENAKDYDSMFKLADKMLYMAKAKGKDRYIFYTPHVHGNILYDGKVMTIAQHMLIYRDKSSTILDLMGDFLLKKEVSFENALERILKAYNLDEFYVLGEIALKSSFGLKMISAGDQKSFEPSELDLTPTQPEDFHPMFSTFPIKVVNMYDLQRENHPRFAQFMAQKNYRVLIVYHMTVRVKGGFLIYVSNAGSSCRFAETDFADLAYFSRMAELSGQCP
jgi:diguanylate cyclase (GGDEF)-like protein